MPAARRRVNLLEDDAEREMERAAGAHERAGELEICARVDQEPGLFLAEAEEPELVEAPRGDALILGGQLERREMVGRWRPRTS